MRRPRSAAFATLVLCMLTAWGSRALKENGGEPQRPNIIFIFSDDHAPHAISAYGSTINQTPNIDRLADEGAIFLNSFCGNSICGPSRATVLTGLHSHANGFMRNGNQFDGNQQTFPKLLQRAGYTTAMIGKWHLSSDPTGFDHWTVLPGQGSYYNPDLITPERRIRIEGHSTNVITDLALRWLADGRDRDKPFVLMCQYKAPHRSWMPGPDDLPLFQDQDIPEPESLFDDYDGRGPAAAQQEMEIDRHMYFAYDLFCPIDEGEHLFRGYRNQIGRLTPEQRTAWDAAFRQENQAFREAMPGMTHAQIIRWKYQRYIKNYLRCVAGVDRNVGRVLDYLDDHPELKRNTIVIYSSDQGFYLGDHGWYDKRWMYEESFRMPLVARWPGVIEPGTRVEELVQNIDYAPTFLDIAGVEPDTPMHGRSLLDLTRDDAEPWRDALYYRYYESRGPHNVAAHYGVRTERYTLIHFYEPEHNYWELYDLEQDPDQMNNVYDDPAYAQVVDRLTRRVTRLREQYRDDQPIGLHDHELFKRHDGIASARQHAGDGWEITASANHAHAMWPLDHPAEALTLSTTVQAASAGGIRNGLIAFADHDGPVLRAGVYIGAGQFVILGPDNQPLAQARIEDHDPSRRHAIAVSVDTRSRTVRLTADGVTLEADLPAGVERVTHVGYGLNQTTTRFGAMRIQR